MCGFLFQFFFFLTSHNGWDKHYTHKKSSSLFLLLSRERGRYSRWRPSRKTWWRGPAGAMLQLQAAFLPLSLHCNFIQLCPLHLPMRHFVTKEICLYCVKAFLSQIMKILKKKKKSPANQTLPTLMHTCDTSVLHLLNGLTNRIKPPSGKTFHCTLRKLRKSQLPTKK